MTVTPLRSLGAISALALAASVSAQHVDESALDALDKATPAVTQPISEPAGAVELRAAMRRISYSPSDADALADAGNASLTLGDANAALNFFTRANTLRPNNGRIVSGLAVATVRTENPFEALRLFDDAVRLGVSERSIAADRALAFDLLGNFSRAQQDYRLARTASTSDDLVIRQAISLSLAGEKGEADAMLVPLLQRNSAAAWRARAFMLAARGDFRESTKVTQGFMDAASAQRMEHYLQLMPDLTGAQQAAAIHLGHFPASQYVGRDSEQVRRVASTIPPVESGPGERRLIPAGNPLGPSTAKAGPVKAEKTPDRKRDRKAKEQQEIKVAAAAIPDSIKLPKTDTSRLGTETARAKVAEAQSARIASVNTNALPPPETARPLVKVESPVAPSQPPVIAAAESATILPAQIPTLNQPSPASPTGMPVSAPASSVATNSGLPAPLPQATPLSAPTVTAANVTETSSATIANIPVSAGGVVQGPTLSGAPLSVPITTPTTTSAAPTVEVVPVVAPAPQPVAAAPVFDLAAIVSSIEIPESEQKPSAVPVDLKKIKPAAPKSAATEDVSKTAKADPKIAAKVDSKIAAKVDPKIAAKAKAEAANPARFWVQIATGEASALGFDYRKWSKKSPELFKGQNGWTSAWGKTSRLLVGPFADMKIAKKWEGDFKKAGGNGFMWKSENGIVVTTLRVKT
jgi:tetratricopeptide (TPR) repeat protein